MGCLWDSKLALAKADHASNYSSNSSEYQSPPFSGPGHALVQTYPHGPIFICCLSAACKLSNLDLVRSLLFYSSHHKNSPTNTNFLMPHFIFIKLIKMLKWSKLGLSIFLVISLTILHMTSVWVISCGCTSCIKLNKIAWKFQAKKVAFSPPQFIWFRPINWNKSISCI